MFLCRDSTASNSIAKWCNKSAIKLKMAKWYVDLSGEAFRISICYRSDTARQLSNRRNLVNLSESARIPGVIVARYRLEFVTFHLDQTRMKLRSSETASGGERRGIRATRGRKPVIKRDTAKSARWWILYIDQSLNYTWWGLHMSLFPRQYTPSAR